MCRADQPRLKTGEAPSHVIGDVRTKTKGVDDMASNWNPVGWFEIPANDFERARGFYEHVFEIGLEEHQIGPFRMAWFPMRPDAIGAAGSLVKGEGYVPADSGVLIYFTAPDINATLARVEAKGGTVLVPKKSIGEYGFIGIFKDSEGNRVGVHSRT